MKPRRRLDLGMLPLICLVSCGPTWQFVSGATTTGPRWLAVLLGAAALFILVVGLLLGSRPRAVQETEGTDSVTRERDESVGRPGSDLEN